MGFFSNLFGGGGGGDYWSGVARELQKIQGIQSQIQGMQAGSGGLPQTGQTNVTALPVSQGYYQESWKRALEAANQPFVPYSTRASDFVAGLTPTQRSAIENISGAAGVADPYYRRASSSLAAAGQDVSKLTPQDIRSYMSPYMGMVVNPVRRALEQQQEQQQMRQQAESIRAGAFGGDRVGLARAQLRGQQELAMGQALSPLYQTGYGQALETARSQQAVEAANRQRELEMASQYGGLGTAALAARLQQGQAQLGAGTLEQQTAQAGKQALYNQFLQQRAYPFQTSQFLTGAATGMGPLYGQSTSGFTVQPAFGNILSDRRAKGGVAGDPADEPEVVGKTFDGQNIYRYRYKDGSAPHIGLMADEVEQMHPDAVGESQGYQTVDYRRATDDAADMARGIGAARMGGAVMNSGDYARGGYADGGVPSLDAILAQHRAAMGLGADAGAYGPTGSSYVSGPAKGGIVPVTNIQPSRPLVASPVEQPEKEKSGLSAAASGLEDVSKISKGLGSAYDIGKEGYEALKFAGGYSSPFASSYAEGGGITDVKGAEYFPEDVLRDIKSAEQLRAEKQSGAQGDQSRSGLGGIADTMGDIGKIAGGIGSLGSLAIKAAPVISSAASGIGGFLTSAIPAALAMFSDPDLKTGVGRKGYEEGGLTAADDTFERMLERESGHKQFDRFGRPLTSSAGAVGIAQVMPGTAPEAAKLAGVEFDPVKYRTDPEYNRALGRAYYNDQLRRFGGDDEKAAAAYNAGPGRVQQAIRRAEASNGDYRSYLPAETRKYISGVMGEGAPINIPTDPRSRSFMASARDLEGGAPQGGVRPTEAPAEEGLADKLLSRQTIIPALVGLGAMASSPSRYVGSAILQGLGAGAKSYMDVGRQIEEQKKIGAETGLLGAQTGAQKATTIETLGRAAKASLVMGPNNMPIAATIYDPKTGGYRYMDFGELYRNRANVNLLPGEIAMIEQVAKERGEAGAPSVSGAPEPTGVKPPEAPKAPSVEAPEVPKPVAVPEVKAPTGALSPVPKIFSLGTEDRAKVGEQLNTLVGTDITGQEKFFRDQEERQKGAALQKPLTFELAAAFSKLPKTGPLAPGALQPKVATLAEYINSIGRIAGKEGIINKADLATLDQIKKVTANLKTTATAANDQTAVRALDEFEQMFPTGKATPEGIARNLATILAMNQKELDKIHYFDDWKKTAASINPSLATASGAMANTSFNEKYNSMYDREMKSLEKMFTTEVKSGGKPVIDEETGRPMNWFEYIAKHGGELSNNEKALIEKSFGQGILRYFTPVQR